MAGEGEFYVTGGTVGLDAESYVSRDANVMLLEALERGEFCYVLTCRQMGKSSLSVRVAERLRQANCSVARLDLTGIGQNLDARQWYDGLLIQLGGELGLEGEVEAFWRGHEHLPPLMRWMQGIREVVLKLCDESMVIFVDEIDFVRSLPFATDEFFAATSRVLQSPHRGQRAAQTHVLLFGGRFAVRPDNGHWHYPVQYRATCGTRGFFVR